jgi:hypothetical protein
MGSVTVTLAAPVNGVPKITTFSPALRMFLGSNFVGKGRGTFTGVTATVLTDSTAGWTAGALSQAATPYFIRFRSGAAAGTWWQVSTSLSSQNTNTSLTVIGRANTTPLALGAAPGDAYELVPGDTLATLFGSIASSIGDTTPALADTVRVHDGVAWHEYHYNTQAGQWREGAAPFNKDNIVIRPDSGVVFIRKHPGSVSLVMTGAISTETERVLVPPTGVTLIGSVFPVSRTLGSLNLNNLERFVPNTGNIAACDKIVVFDGVAWHSFNYHLASGQWREGSAPFNKNSYAIPFGSPIYIERGSGASGPPGLVSLAPPYTL